MDAVVVGLEGWVEWGLGLVEAILRVVPWYYMAVGGAAVGFFWESYLDLRQIRHLLVASVPQELGDWVTIDMPRFKKRNAWAIMQHIYNRIEATLEFIGECLVLSSHLLVWFWDVTEPMLDAVGLGVEYKIMRGLLFISLVSFASSMCRVPFHLFRILWVDAPFDWRKAFPVLEEWFREQSKMFLLSLIFGVPLLMTLLVLLNWDFRFYWFWTSVFVGVLGVFFTDIYHHIAPLFDRFNEQPEGDLKNQIRGLARRLHCPLSGVLVVEKPAGPTGGHCAHSNAFLMGFRFEKKFVLYDSLLKQLEPAEILAILGHEIGHHHYSHIYKVLLLQLIWMGVYIFLFSRIINMPEFYSSFGFTTSDASIGLVLFSFIYTTFALLVQWTTNYINRRYEFAADRYAIQHKLYKLGSALIKIHAHNLSNLMPDPLYAHYHFSHPSLFERLARIRHLKRKLKRKARGRPN